MSKEGLLAGRHVLCEKPLATSVAAAAELVALAASNKLQNCTSHNLHYYPMVQQMRRMVEAGDVGEITTVQGTYSQDWLLFDTDCNWRIETKENGAS
jgi:predicted dehydrogenase